MQSGGVIGVKKTEKNIYEMLPLFVFCDILIGIEIEGMRNFQVINFSGGVLR